MAIGLWGWGAAITISIFINGFTGRLGGLDLFPIGGAAIVGSLAFWGAYLVAPFSISVH